jgi:hypothetical protein
MQLFQRFLKSKYFTQKDMTQNQRYKPGYGGEVGYSRLQVAISVEGGGGEYFHRLTLDFTDRDIPFILVTEKTVSEAASSLVSLAILAKVFGFRRNDCAIRLHSSQNSLPSHS